MNVIQRGIKKLKEEDPYNFLKNVSYFIYFKTMRSFMPTIGHVEKNYIKMPLEFMQEKRLDSLMGCSKSNKNFEGGLINCHKKMTKRGDSITIIAGGFGVSATHASRITGELKSSKITIYEGSKYQYNIIKKVLEINNVKTNIILNKAIVGEPINVYGDGSEITEVINPEILDDCDVLELDCGGSEMYILEKMKIRPRKMIIEIHPWLFSNGKKYTDLLKLISSYGYTIIHKYGHDGKVIESDSELTTLLKLSQINDKKALAISKKKLKKNGKPIFAVVIGAVRK